MSSPNNIALRWFCSAALSLVILFVPLMPPAAAAQDTVTGAFAGQVSERGSSQRKVIAGARIVIQNLENGVRYVRRSDASGNFYQGALQPGNYLITVEAAGYQTRSLRQRLFATKSNQVVPVPVELDPVGAPTPATPTVTTTTTTPTATPSTATTTTTTTTTTPATTGTTQPTTTTTTPTVAGATTPPTPVVPPASQIDADENEATASENFNRTDGRRGGAFTEREVSTLPLGATTLVRTFDELALLLPGVTLPPYTLGNVAGPGVGAGVGSAGQFSANGLPPRTNNFTVDGSDNNDEDIGVRRQGFVALVPQPIESIQEYQVITLLAPAQFGRNIGAQVNAISKSGGNNLHGTAYGFINSDRLNARNFFDTSNGTATSQLIAGNNQRVTIEGITASAPDAGGVRTFTRGAAQPFNITNESAGEDSFTLGQFGFVLGGPIKREKLFFFISAERQILNAAQEANFAVPTLEQRGFDNSGATGLFQDRFNFFTPAGVGLANPPPTPVRLENQTLFGAAIYSLFPLPNNPGGVYGRNTLTQVLPANGRGTVASGKIDYTGTPDFTGGRLQSLTARYNFTEDKRDLPVTGGAIFSSLRPQVTTNNFSTFLNSELSSPNSTAPVFNQLRLSYGRTRLNFNELRNTSFLVNSRQPFRDTRFLLNAPLVQNITLPPSAGVPNTGNVTLARITNLTSEDITGPLGQVNISGYSPVGVDPFNFPQRRVNNTYQIADTVTYRTGPISFAFGTDIRRTELNSDLPRNSRPLITFNGTPALQNNPALGGLGQIPAARGIPFIDPTVFAAAGLPTGFFQSLTLGGNESGNLGLRYYQFDFFGQQEVRLLPNLSLSLGVRYELNTPPREMNQRIENAFAGVNSALDPGIVSSFIEGRTDQIFDPDRNNIAPRLGVAWSPNIFGFNRPTVFRGGFGVYYDQILGSVVSQSRNIYPAFLPLNFSTINVNGNTPLSAVIPREARLSTTDPTLAAAGPCIFVSAALTPTCRPGGTLLITPGTLNTLNPALNGTQSQSALIAALSRAFPNSFSFTLPRRRLEMPMAYHYSYTVEQGLPYNMVVSAAYAGTLGRNLLRVTTPLLGPNVFPVISNVNQNALRGATGIGGPQIQGVISRPVRIDPRNPAVNFIGAFNIIETTARSRYDSFQVGLRGRFMNRLQYQAAYTYSATFDEVSDVFDVAGASALPQDSRTSNSEYARSNFDVPHRFTYNFVWDAIPGTSGLLVAGTGQFQSGQPYTINSIIDVNLDGNLTDRLNTRDGLVITDSRRQPVQLSPEILGDATGTRLRNLLAPLGFNGSVRRNDFRSGNFAIVNLTVIKKFAFTEDQNLSLRMDVFNLTNRANFGIPVRFLEAPGFGSATDTVTPGRRIQFALKYSF